MNCGGSPIVVIAMATEFYLSTPPMKNRTVAGVDIFGVDITHHDPRSNASSKIKETIWRPYPSTMGAAGIVDEYNYRNKP